MTVELLTVFPERFDVNGDRGNVLTLCRRLEWAGVAVSVTELTLGDSWPEHTPDLVHVGGGSVAAQRSALSALLAERERLRDWLASGTVYLAIAGGLHVSATRIRLPGDEEECDGLGIFAGSSRPTGTFRSGFLVGRTDDWGALVGYEHLSQGIELGTSQRPLSTVESGSGNVFSRGTDGAASGTAFGSHAHGPLLPKNPRFADHLLRLAIEHAESGEFRLNERHRAADALAQRGRAALGRRLRLAALDGTAQKPNVSR